MQNPNTESMETTPLIPQVGPHQSRRKRIEEVLKHFLNIMFRGYNYQSFPYVFDMFMHGWPYITKRRSFSIPMHVVLLVSPLIGLVDAILHEYDLYNKLKNDNVKQTLKHLSGLAQTGNQGAAAAFYALLLVISIYDYSFDRHKKEVIVSNATFLELFIPAALFGLMTFITKTTHHFKPEIENRRLYRYLDSIINGTRLTCKVSNLLNLSEFFAGYGFFSEKRNLINYMAPTILGAALSLYEYKRPQDRGRTNAWLNSLSGLTFLLWTIFILQNTPDAMASWGIPTILFFVAMTMIPLTASCFLKGNHQNQELQEVRVQEVVEEHSFQSADRLTPLLQNSFLKNKNPFLKKSKSESDLASYIPCTNEFSVNFSKNH